MMFGVQRRWLLASNVRLVLLSPNYGRWICLARPSRTRYWLTDCSKLQRRTPRLLIE
jgi:hypothetical protein